MDAIRKMAVMPLALLAIACGKQTQARSAPVGDELRSDLERAAAPTSDLAATRFRPTEVVSSIELGTAPAARSPEVPRKQKVHRVTPSIKPQVAQVKAEAPEPAPQPTIVAVTPAPEPTAGPRPTPNPVDYPAGSGTESGGDRGGGLGGVIGVIIRGGGIGDNDHCEIHRGVPPMINQRFPSPIGRTTFPMRGGW